MHINKLVVIGVGLIGGSLALALRQAGVVGEIVGVGRSSGNPAGGDTLQPLRGLVRCGSGA